MSHLEDPEGARPMPAEEVAPSNGLALPAPREADGELVLADLAHSLHQRLMGIEADLTARFFQIGYILLEIRSQELWRFLGHDGFLPYLGALGMRRSSAYKYMAVYKTYVVDLALGDRLERIAGIDLQKLDSLRTVVTSLNWEHWIEKARELSRSDLRVEIDTARAVKRLRSRGVEVSVQPTTEPPEGAAFGAENASLASLMGDIIEDLVMTPYGLILRTDSGSRLRVWAVGDELRVDVKPWKPTAASADVEK